MDFYGERIQVLGEGTYGKVHLVKITSGLFLGHLIAEKISHGELAYSLLGEKQILDQFYGSPHIIQCYGFSTNIDLETDVFSISLFLELATGLLDLMKDYGGKIPEQHVKCYAEMILKGLLEMHCKGYIHSDLKPANLLVFHRGDCSDLPVLKIADFGLAKVSGVKDTGDWEYGFRGTPPYMSPESIDGEISGALDVWSVGCIDFEMITGAMAWNYQEPEELREKLLLGEKPKIPENMSASGKDFLMKCFAINPNERWNARMLLDHPFLQPERATIFLPHEFDFLMSSTEFADNNEEKSTLATNSQGGEEKAVLKSLEEDFSELLLAQDRIFEFMLPCC